MPALKPMFSALALAAGALLAAAPVHAVGNLVDVHVIDRATGQPLRVYRHDQQWWVAGQADEIIVIRYDSHENLVALGVIAGEQSRQPAAFPRFGATSYPDPPDWP